MKLVRSTVAMVVATLFAPCTSLAQTPTATRALLDANPGTQAMFERERLVALYGKPFATDNDPGTTTDDFVARFVGEHGDALGVENVSLVLDNRINIRNDKFAVYTYTQHIEGLPVEGSTVKIPVLLGAQEKIGYVGIRLSQPPPSPLPPDLVSASTAIEAIRQSATYAHLADFTNPEKVVFDAGGGELRRAWRFVGYDADESYRFFVDTNTGKMLWAHSLIFNSHLTGLVKGYATPCCAPGLPSNPLCPDEPGVCPADDPQACPDPGTDCATPDPHDSCCCGADNPDNACSPDPALMLMRGAQVSVYAQASPDCTSDPEGGTLVAQAFTNDFGRYLFFGITPPVTVVTRLIGEWSSVDNCPDEPDCSAADLMECLEGMALPLV